MFNYNENFGWNPFSSPFVKLQNDEGKSNKMFFFYLTKTIGESKFRELKSRDIFNFDVKTALFYCTGKSNYSRIQ